MKPVTRRYLLLNHAENIQALIRHKLVQTPVDRRIGERSVMTAEVEVWTKARNDKKIIADWQYNRRRQGEVT